MSQFYPIIPQSIEYPTIWPGLMGCADAFALAHAIQNENRLFVIVMPDNQSALRLEQELTFFYKVNILSYIFPIGKPYLTMFFTIT